MNMNKRLRGWAIALGAFLLWGNLVSLMLPAENYPALVKTVDFATVVFLLAGLITAAAGGRKAKSAPGRAPREKAAAD